MSTDLIKTIHFDRIDQLFDFFAPWGDDPRKAGINLDGYVFRGHSDSNYQLVPSALRDNSIEILYRAANIKNETDTPLKESVHAKLLASQVLAEWRVIRNFYKLADQHGLALPSAASLRSNMANSHDVYGHMAYYPTEWLTEPLLDAAALAQHYGLPTRLLDWTYDCFVALFFALNGIDSTDGEACVVALNKEYISGTKYTVNQIDIEFVTPPYFGNPNLNAQKGLFTHVHQKLRKEGNTFPRQEIDRRPIDIVLSSLKHAHNENLLLKLIFPRAFASKGLSMLLKLGYGNSRIFPGYKGVADEILNRDMENPSGALSLVRMQQPVKL